MSQSTGPNAERRKFLADRLKTFVKLQPEILELKKLLLALGGHEVVVPTVPDSTIPFMIANGIVFPSHGVLRKMQHSDCHINAAQLWSEKQFGIIAVGSGFALSEDGLWRTHSWGFDDRGRVIETTVKRSKYFGIVLGSLFADKFAKAMMGK
jgi:hypothetical protein